MDKESHPRQSCGHTVFSTTSTSQATKQQQQDPWNIEKFCYWYQLVSFVSSPSSNTFHCLGVLYRMWRSRTMLFSSNCPTPRQLQLTKHRLFNITLRQQQHQPMNQLSTTATLQRQQQWQKVYYHHLHHPIHRSHHYRPCRSRCWVKLWNVNRNERVSCRTNITTYIKRRYMTRIKAHVHWSIQSMMKALIPSAWNVLSRLMCLIFTRQMFIEMSHVIFLIGNRIPPRPISRASGWNFPVVRVWFTRHVSIPTNDRAIIHFGQECGAMKTLYRKAKNCSHGGRTKTTLGKRGPSIFES